MREEAKEQAKGLIRRFEGLSLHRYLCPAGYETIGYGHRIVPRDKIGATIGHDTAEDLLEKDVMKACKGVFQYTMGIELADYQLAALISFVFNVGVGAFAGSTMRRRIMAEDFAGVSAEFGKWVYGTVDGKKKTLKGLVARRDAERGVWDGKGAGEDVG